MKKRMYSNEKRNLLKRMESLRVKFEFYLDRKRDEAGNDIQELHDWIDETLNLTYREYLAYAVMLRSHNVVTPRIDGTISDGSELEHFFSKEQIRYLVNLKPDKVS